MRIGILAMQGAVQPHRAKLSALGIEAPIVRSVGEMETCAGLILPGGESTTMLKLLHQFGLWEPLRQFGVRKPLWGICAGSILMASQVENPAQECLEMVPVTVRRNAYGRQNESFITTLDLTLPEGDAAWRESVRQEAVFIRAPRILGVTAGVRVLASQGGDPVVVQHGRHLLTTFHPELSAQNTLHQHFAALCDVEARQSLPTENLHDKARAG